MACFFRTSRVVLMLCSFCMSTALELIVNPSASTISCGTNDNCTVICNVTESCQWKTFYFYNHSIDMECSAWYACRSATIFTSNVQSFTATMTSDQSFLFARLYTSSTDIDINIKCGDSHSSQSCFGADFHYLNQGESTHSCEDGRSCWRSMINAVSAVSLVCKGSLSCRIASFILSTDEQQNQQSSITVFSGYSDPANTIKVYSLYPFTNFISADGTAFDLIHFIYGMRFNQYCIVSDTSCMNSVPARIGNYDELTIIHTYPDGNPSQSLSYDGDLLIVATLDHVTFTPPSIPDANTLSILCLRCFEVNLQLGGIKNAVLADGGGDSYRFVNTDVRGPTGYFELNIMHWSRFNKFYLQNTSRVVAHSLGENTDVYLGNALDVEIHCPFQSDGALYYKCIGVNIWSTLQRNELHLATSRAGYWDLNTSYEFLIHFDFEQHACTYIDYASNCSFMTFNPTGAPTQPSHHPSYKPSQHPTNDPSANPSQPTGNATTDISIATYNPSHYPTNDPPANPSQPTGNATTNISIATYNPSHYPSLQPSEQPTRGREQEVESTIEWILGGIVIGLSVVLICTAIALIVLCYGKLSSVVSNINSGGGAGNDDCAVNENVSHDYKDAISDSKGGMARPGNVAVQEDSETDSAERIGQMGTILRNIPLSLFVTKQGIEETRGVHDDNVMEEVEGVQNIDVKSDKQATGGDVLYQRCVDCERNSLGKVDNANGLFYCNECWEAYIGEGQRGYNDTIPDKKNTEIDALSDFGNTSKGDITDDV